MTTPKHLCWMFACALWACTAGPAAAGDIKPATELNRQFITRAFERWTSGSGDFFRDVLAPDVRWTIKGSGPAAGTYAGREDFLERAVQPFVARLATPIRPTVKAIWADGDDVIVHWDGSATAGDGSPYRNSYIWIFRMANGRASEVTAFLDLAAYDDVLRRVSARKSP